MFPAPIERSSPRKRYLYYGAVVVTLVAWLLPLLAVLLTSIRSAEDLNMGNYWGWPKEWKFSNYIEIFQATPLARYLFNSVVITLPAVVCAIALATLGGYALAKFKFRGNLLMFCIFVGGNFVPFQILMVPVRNMTLRFGLLDTYWALILFHLAFQTGFCTLFMRNFISTLPNALIESARVEGVNELKIFWYIIVPLLRPALAALAVLLFTFVWNDYFWALVLVQSDSVKPITTGIASLRGQWLASWQLISAGSVVAALPPVAMFFILQRQFIAGLTLGAVK
jgi:multiple sugar transport system permease protein